MSGLQRTCSSKTNIISTAISWFKIIRYRLWNHLLSCVLTPHDCWLHPCFSFGALKVPFLEKRNDFGTHRPGCYPNSHGNRNSWTNSRTVLLALGEDMGDVTGLWGYDWIWSVAIWGTCIYGWCKGIYIYIHISIYVYTYPQHMGV